jgi:hypothetical protein
MELNVVQTESVVSRQYAAEAARERPRWWHPPWGSIIYRSRLCDDQRRGATVNQEELRRMAEERILDAIALLDAGRWEFGYYVAGYAVECGLKSCLLARMVHTAWVFREKWEAKVCLTHDFAALVKLAGLNDELNNKLGASAAAAAAEGGPPGGAFAANWGSVLQWKPESRYTPKTETQARELYGAITHDPDGVLQWIRNYW